MCAVSAFVKLPIAQMLREERPSAPTWPGLILEVTEDEALKDLQDRQRRRRQLRELGCALALDDFGAGYSSLARLRQLPFSELKIDRSYVSHCDSDPSMPACARPSSRLGKRFGLQDGGRGHRDA